MINPIAYGMRTRAETTATAAAMARSTNRLISRWTNACSRLESDPVVDHGTLD
jgi:hypothetical protein